MWLQSSEACVGPHRQAATRAPTPSTAACYHPVGEHLHERDDHDQHHGHRRTTEQSSAGLGGSLLQRE